LLVRWCACTHVHADFKSRVSSQGGASPRHTAISRDGQQGMRSSCQAVAGLQCTCCRRASQQNAVLSLLQPLNAVLSAAVNRVKP
jgi:hypothetical protein